MQLQIKVSKSQYEEAVVGFRQKLYTALAEVENALSARVQLEREAEQRAVAGPGAARRTSRRALFAAGARPPCSRGSTSSSGCATRKAPTS